MIGGRNHSVVYVVAKAPQAGVTKTRLCPPLLPHQAATLAAAFLRDTVTLAARAEVTVRLICRNAQERAALLPLVPGDTTVHVQQGSGLGEALRSAFVQGFADGFGAVAVLGADTPTLPPAVLTQAFDALDMGADVSLGPSCDGGYYLLAANRTYTPLFQGMRWSTSDVAAETRRRCVQLGLTIHHLAVWSDADDADSLEALRAFLARADAEVAPHTRAALEVLDNAVVPWVQRRK